MLTTIRIEISHPDNGAKGLARNPIVSMKEDTSLKLKPPGQLFSREQ